MNAREEGVFADIEQERIRQDEKWGDVDHRGEYWLAILSEEVGEVAREVLEGRESVCLYDELIQVAAVAVAWAAKVRTE